MSYERSDFQEFVDSPRYKRPPQRDRARLEMMAQAEVKAEHVTGDAIWDWFASYITSAVERTQDSKSALEAQLQSIDLVDDNEVRRIRTEIICCNTRIDAWNAVLSLPKDLKAMGEEAKGLLER